MQGRYVMADSGSRTIIVLKVIKWVVQYGTLSSLAVVSFCREEGNTTPLKRLRGRLQETLEFEHNW